MYVFIVSLFIRFVYIYQVRDTPPPPPRNTGFNSDKGYSYCKPN